MVTDTNGGQRLKAKFKMEDNDAPLSDWRFKSLEDNSKIYWKEMRKCRNSFQQVKHYSAMLFGYIIIGSKRENKLTRFIKSQGTKKMVLWLCN